MELLTSERRAEIDALILAKAIIGAQKSIMAMCGVGLREAQVLFRARYQQLRVERGAEFACSDEAYWSGYSECIFDAMSRGL